MGINRFRSNYWSSRLLVLSFFSVLLSPDSANATELASLRDYLKFSFKDLLSQELTTASHTPQSIQDSPYTVSVITDDQIKNSGARDIFDLLLHVPGIQIATTNRGRPVVSMRGISRPTTDYILFMLNGHPLNEPANGSATFHFGLAKVMDGYEATQHIHKKNPGLPVIAVTAHALIEEHDKCLAAGMVDLVTKPVEEDELIATIRKHVDISS